MAGTRVVLTIAGFDPSAGAGIAGDLKTISALEGYGVAVITAITVQNTLGVLRVEPIPGELVLSQAAALLDDFEVSAIKLGMIPSLSVLEAVTAILDDRGEIPVVCDPVLTSSSGHSLSGDVSAAALIERLFSRANLLTPNLDEVEKLTGMKVRNTAQMAEAGLFLKSVIENRSGRTPPDVLVKGGHLEGQVVDVLCSNSGSEVFAGETVDSPGNRGTGCALSSAIATLLAQGYPLTESISRGRKFVVDAMRRAPGLGRGKDAGGGPLGHLS